MSLWKGAKEERKKRRRKTKTFVPEAVEKATIYIDVEDEEDEKNE